MSINERNKTYLSMDVPPFQWRANCSLPALLLELNRAFTAERQVLPDGIVEPVDISGYSILGPPARLPRNRPDQFGLQIVPDHWRVRVPSMLADPTCRRRKSITKILRKLGAGTAARQIRPNRPALALRRKPISSAHGSPPASVGALHIFEASPLSV